LSAIFGHSCGLCRVMKSKAFLYFTTIAFCFLSAEASFAFQVGGTYEFTNGKSYKIETHVDGGAYGEVFVVVDMTSGIEGKRYALKAYSHSGAPKNMSNPKLYLPIGIDTLKEHVISLENDALVPYEVLKTKEIQPERAVLMPLAQSSLFDAEKEYRIQEVEKAEFDRLITNNTHLVERLFLALRFLAKNNLTHRDIKPKNVLVYSTDIGLRPALADNDLAIRLNSKTAREGKGISGSLPFIAPELHNQKKLSIMNDYWSTAITLVKTLTGAYPVDPWIERNVGDPPADWRMTADDVEEIRANSLFALDELIEKSLKLQSQSQHRFLLFVKDLIDAAFAIDPEERRYRIRNVMGRKYRKADIVTIYSAVIEKLKQQREQISYGERKPVTLPFRCMLNIQRFLRVL
jgi:serine/threonine protein kinase